MSQVLLDSGESINNNDKVLNYCLYYSIFFLIRVAVVYILRKYFSKKDIEEKESDELTAKKKQIEELKRESQKYNNPSEFVKHAKLERQISKLQKELNEQIKTTMEQNNNSTAMNQALSNMQIPLFTQIKIIIEVLFVVFHILFFLYCRNERLRLPIDITNISRKNDNIVLGYFFNEEMNSVAIPMNIILITEALFLFRITKVLENFL